jgi:hypothetical protein
MGILALMIHAGYGSNQACRRGVGRMGGPWPGRKDYDQE